MLEAEEGWAEPVCVLEWPVGRGRLYDCISVEDDAWQASYSFAKMYSIYADDVTIDEAESSSLEGLCVFVSYRSPTSR